MQKHPYHRSHLSRPLAISQREKPRLAADAPHRGVHRFRQPLHNVCAPCEFDNAGSPHHVQSAPAAIRVKVLWFSGHAANIRSITPYIKTHPQEGRKQTFTPTVTMTALVRRCSDPSAERLSWREPDIRKWFDQLPVRGGRSVRSGEVIRRSSVSEAVTAALKKANEGFPLKRKAARGSWNRRLGRNAWPWKV